MEKPDKKLTSFFANNLGSNNNQVKDLYKRLDLLEKRVKVLETENKKLKDEHKKLMGNN